MSAYSQLILSEPSLLSYWRLNEDVGATAIEDEGPGGITGTALGAESGAWRGSSLLINEPGNTCGVLINVPEPFIPLTRFTFGTNYPFTGTSSYTAEAWINPSAEGLSQNGYVICNIQNDPSENGWAFRILAAGGIRQVRWLDGVLDQAQSTTGLIVADTTYHLVATYDGTTMLCYQNGVQVATAGSTMSLSGIPATLSAGSFGGAGNACSGRIDEAAIYSTALSPENILEHYQVGITPAIDPSDNSPIFMHGKGMK